MLAVNETVMVAAVFVVDTGYMASTVAADLAREPWWVLEHTEKRFTVIKCTCIKPGSQYDTCTSIAS